MADQLNLGAFNLPELAKGEQPSHLKWNRSFANMFERLTQMAEYMSDLTSLTAANDILSDRALTTPGLGRALGPIGNFQPPAPTHTNFAWSGELTTGFNEWHLPASPYDTAGNLHLSLSTSAASTDYDGSQVFSTQLASTQALTAPGQWKYLPEQNKIVSYSLLVGTSVTLNSTSYLGARNGTGLPWSWYPGNASQNVMPDWYHNPATSITVATSTDPTYGYVVTMHPELYAWNTPPINTSNARMSTAQFGAAAALFETPRAGVSPLLNVSGRIAQTLPYQLQSLSAGDEIPRPFVSLYQEGTNGSLLSVGQYFYKDQTSFYYKGAALNVSGTYRVVTPGGMDIATLLEGLRFHAEHHKHRGAQAISHRDLMNQGYNLSTDEFPVAAIANNEKYGWHRPTQPATWDGNPHPQYLLRNGYYAGADPGNLDGVMMGPLALGLQSTNARLAETGDVYGATNRMSWPLDFGGRAQALISTDQNGVQHLHLWPDGCRGLGIGEFPSGFFEATDHGYWNIGPNNTIQNGSTSDYAFHLLQGDNIQSIIHNSVGAGHFVRGSLLDVRSSDCQFVSAHVAGENATARIHDSTHVHLSVLANNGHVKVQGVNGAWVHVSQTSTDITTVDTSVVSPYGGYLKLQSFTVDAESRPVTRPITPDKMKLIHVDSSVTQDQHWVFSNAESTTAEGHITSINHRLLPSPTWGLNGAVATPSGGYDNLDVVCFLDMESDSHLSAVRLSMAYKDASLAILGYQINGTTTLLASTSLPTNPSIAGTDITWTIGTGIGTIGSRYPNLNGSAIDLVLRISDMAVTGGLEIFGGTYTYHRKRF